MVVILQDLCRILLAEQLHAANQQASGLENLDVMDSEFNTGLSQGVHNLPTETLPIRVRTESDPVACALKDSASLVWGYVRESLFSPRQP